MDVQNDISSISVSSSSSLFRLPSRWSCAPHGKQSRFVSGQPQSASSFPSLLIVSFQNKIAEAVRATSWLRYAPELCWTSPRALIFEKLRKARSRVYQPRLLQPILILAELFEIYRFWILLQRLNLNKVRGLRPKSVCFLETFANAASLTNSSFFGPNLMKRFRKFTNVHNVWNSLGQTKLLILGG